MNTRPHRCVRLATAALTEVALLVGVGAGGAAPFAIQGPGVNPADFRITVFASGLGFPLGMVPLSDGSLLVTVVQGTSFWSGTWQVLRLTDTNQDGIADDPGTVLFTGSAVGQSSMRMCGNLVFLTGQATPITILRAGPTPGSPLTLVGQLNVTYPSGGWEHPHSALGIRPTPGQAGRCDLFFQLGSDQNYAKTTRTASLSSTQIPGASGTLQGESIYMLTLTDDGTNVAASNLTRVAMGLRNAAGFAFQPVSGDLYFEDNGIDGLANANEPLSTDEINLIPAAQIGNGIVPDFGFPTNYTEYRTGRLVGGGGVQPLFAFQPLPNPFTGSESEGPNDIAFAPAGFPPALNNGLFVGFHGKWALAGIANEENPVVFADLTTTNYFQFIGNDEPNIGHLDGLLSTDDSLFLADLTSTGDTSSSVNSGIIYQIKSLVAHVLSFALSQNGLRLSWSQGGALQQATSLAGPWSTIATGTNTFWIPIDPAQPQVFYRTQY
jgi:glucose/arabinose dehydrogenase